MTDVHEWYESNKLVINTSKSNLMLLTTRQMLSHMTDTDLNAYIGNHQLLQCRTIKYIGVDIDSVLSWDIQTDSNHQLLQCSNIKYIRVDIDNVLSWDIRTDSISKKLVFIISSICLCIFIRALSNRKLTMQYRHGAIRPHIILTNSSGCKTELR